MSIVTQQNITQQFLGELTSHSPKAEFTPFEKIAEALKYLEEKGIPNNKTEDYKYCNVEAVIRKEFKTLSSSFTEPDPKFFKALRTDENAIYVFVVNGRISISHSDLKNLPKGLTILPIENAWKEKAALFKKHFGKYALETSDAFIAMNTAFAGTGVFIHIEKSAVIEKTVRIVYSGQADENIALNTRNLIAAEENAQFNFTEVFAATPSKGKIFSNTVSEIAAAENAILNHTIIQEGAANFYGINTTQVQQEKQSNYSINTFTFSGSLIRNNLNIVVSGEHAETHLNGLAVTNEMQNVDNHTLVDHAAPNCESNELYKGVASGKSTLTFNGKIFVRRDSQKINAYQSSKNILMSDDASVNTKPQLEIFANDVKCSHGTSTGKVDEEAMFYLKARGIGDASARRLLLHAFAGEVIEKIKNDTLRSEIEQKLEAALNF